MRLMAEGVEHQAELAMAEAEKAEEEMVVAGRVKVVAATDVVMEVVERAGVVTAAAWKEAVA